MARRPTTTVDRSPVMLNGHGRGPNARVASARKVRLDDKRAVKAQIARRQDWQDDAWSYFDEVPEIKASTWYLGNQVAKVRLFAAVLADDPEAPPIPLSDPGSGIPAGVAMRAQAEIDRLRSALGGQAEIMREGTMNLEIAGEFYLVGFAPYEREERLPDGTTGMVVYPEEWDVKSVSEVRVDEGGDVKVSDAPGSSQAGRKLDKDRGDSITRIWQRHPRYSELPDCAMRGVLDTCETLTLLTNQVKAEAKSHQPAGILLIPNELSFGPADPTEPEDGDEASSDPFGDELYDAITEPITDPSSAASVYPLVIRGPAEHLKEVRHVSMARTTDATLEGRIEKAIERLARGLNLPPEAVMGHAETTFANAKQIDRDKFEEYLEPRCVMLADALTVGFLRPNLIEHAGVAPDVAERVIVWFDPSALFSKPEPSDSANEGYDRNTISGEAWRRSKGWSEDDAPDELELLIRAGLRRGILTAELTKALIDLLGIELDVEPIATSANDTTPTDEGGDEQAAASTELLRIAELMRARSERRGLAAAASLPPGRRLMELDRELRQRLLVAADRAMTRALERAGNRIRSKAGATRAVVAGVHSLYVAQHLGPTLLAQAGITDSDLFDDDAWDELERQFMAWAGQAQADALGIAATLATLAPQARAQIAVAQGNDLAEAWALFRAELVRLAHVRLYDPDPAAPTVGESDLTSRVPAGLVRETVAVAGGATGLQVDGDDIYVVLSNGQPVGGIGTGARISQALRDHGVSTEAYEWVYGPAFRSTPFEYHAALDGAVFQRFDDPVLAQQPGGEWPAGSHYFPGDHAGCQCDLVPVYTAPAD